MDRITHFSHPHPLELVPTSQWICKCGLCGIDIEDECYQCSFRILCSYSLHSSCAKYSEKMNHPFHPQHTLIYKKDKGRNGYWRKCGACGIRPYEEFGYFCMDCKYALHLKCAALTPIGEFPGEKLPNVIHQHSLLECFKTPWDHFQYLCGTCGEDFQDYAHIYVCQECPSLMHKTCARLPNDITHPFHLQHPPLKLANKIPITKSVCDACGEYFRSSNNFYQCSVCHFTLDVHCAFLIPISNRLASAEQTDTAQPYRHLHPHPLIECQGIKCIRRQCSGCNQPFEESSIHVCLQCSILLDTPCINACPKIYHPLHHQHRLILGKGYSECNVCRKYNAKYFYSCAECNRFCLDLQCSREKIDFVHSEIHKHDLAYFYFKIGGGRCSTCRTWCVKFVFHCIECDLYIHDHCLPSLPQTIKHECHCDPLTLSLTPIRNYPDQDIKGAEFYCCACEELREFHEPTYYCAECHFVAHVHCVISEIISYLKLQPRTFHERSKKEVETYPDMIFLSLSESSQNRNTEDDSEETDPHAAEPEVIRDANPPVSQQLYDDIPLLQKEVDALAAEISEVTAKVDELKQRYSQRAESLEKKLLERNGGHDQTLQPASVSSS